VHLVGFTIEIYNELSFPYIKSKYITEQSNVAVIFTRIYEGLTGRYYQIYPCTVFAKELLISSFKTTSFQVTA